LVPTGLISSIYDAALAIDFGRKGFATRGKEQEGRINYEKGIANAMTAFQKASNQRFASTADSQTIILAEYTFLSQELQFCEATDKDSLSSLTQAIQSFDWKARCIPRQYYKFPCQRRNRRFLHDAFLALKVVEDKIHYQGVENCFPHNKKYRVSGFPKDAFHIACIGHKTRLQNILRTPGLDPIEKSLLKQRFVNLSAGQSGYVEMQKKALIK
jgi:hypothetical protein